MAPLRSAYSRHLILHHGLRLRSRRTPYGPSVDYIEEMTPGEASRRQRRLSSRQGGRQRQRAALRQIIDAELAAETSASSSHFRVASVSATHGRRLRPEGYHSSTPSSDTSGGTTNESDYSDLGDMEWCSEHFPDLAATEYLPCPPPVAAPVPPTAAAARQPSPPPPPPPFLEAPPVSIPRLIAITADAVARHPAARMDMVEDAVVQEVALHAALPQPQERAVRLAVGFGVGLLGSLSRRLLDSVAARYASDALTPQHVLAMFMAEELEIWSRRAPVEDDVAANN